VQQAIEMQHPFPVFLNLAGRKCVVLGAGPLADEKATALRQAGAEVRVVAESPGESDLDGAFLAVSTLPDPALNHALFESAARRGILFNALDDPANCAFYFPAVYRQGALVAALSTSGQCPALAVRLKEKLATWIGPEYGEFLGLASAIRTRLRASGLSFAERRRIWYRLVDSPAIEWLGQGRRVEAERLIGSMLDEELSAASVEVRS
jgi:siroheme synthase-like protein